MVFQRPRDRDGDSRYGLVVFPLGELGHKQWSKGFPVHGVGECFHPWTCRGSFESLVNDKDLSRRDEYRCNRTRSISRPDRWTHAVLINSRRLSG